MSKELQVFEQTAFTPEETARECFTFFKALLDKYA